VRHVCLEAIDPAVFGPGADHATDSD
jgi:hypothetical protein